jgi:hypothetical protein
MGALRDSSHSRLRGLPSLTGMLTAARATKAPVNSNKADSSNDGIHRPRFIFSHPYETSFAAYESKKAAKAL